jgi:hypothetical protein
MVLGRTYGLQQGILELPTGAGESRIIPTGELHVHSAYFFPDGRHILDIGSARGSNALRLWVEDIEGSTPRPISPEGVNVGWHGCISPDGKQVAAQDPQGEVSIYPVATGAPVVVPNTQPGEAPIQWTPDGKALRVGRREVPSHVFCHRSGDRTTKAVQSVFASGYNWVILECTSGLFARPEKLRLYLPAHHLGFVRGGGLAVNEARPVNADLGQRAALA